MTFQLHPIAFGVMLVVAVGTFAYTLWNSRAQRNDYASHEDRRRSREYYPQFDFDECASTRSSIPDDEPQPSKRKRNSDRCAICLGALKESLKTLPCRHIFHQNCITVWFVENNTCPICRQVPS